MSSFFFPEARLIFRSLFTDIIVFSDDLVIPYSLSMAIYVDMKKGMASPVKRSWGDHRKHLKKGKIKPAASSSFIFKRDEEEEEPKNAKKSVPHTKHCVKG